MLKRLFSLIASWFTKKSNLPVIPDTSKPSELPNSSIPERRPVVTPGAFERAFAYTILNEGGEFTDDPDDRGGPTKWGITQHDLSTWLGRPATKAEVMNLTKEQVKPIYKAFYWDVLKCDQLNDPELAMCIYDQGVLRGCVGISKAVQRICGLKVTGSMDQATISYLNSKDDDEMIRLIKSQADGFYKSIVDNNPSQGKFLRGWLNRAGRLLGLVDKA